MFCSGKMRMEGGTCFGVVFTAVLCLCVVQSVEGQAKLCDLQGGYDINTLRSVPYWTVRVDSKFQCPNFKPGVNKECFMYLSFCQVLPINNTVPAGFCRVVDMELQNSKDASICAVVDRKLDNQTTSTFGQYLPQLVPFKTLQVEDGKTGFESQSAEGNSFKSVCNQTTSFIQFRCDPAADWSTTTNHDVTKFLLSANFDLFEPCWFVMNVAYKGACLPVPAQTDPGIVGFVLIAVLLVAIAAYLIIGSVINLALGKRSARDVFPNYAFWVGFPYLLLDGVRFSFHLVTCFYFSPTGSPLGGQGRSKSQYDALS